MSFNYHTNIDAIFETHSIFGVHSNKTSLKLMIYVVNTCYFIKKMIFLFDLFEKFVERLVLFKNNVHIHHSSSLLLNIYKI